MSARVQHENLSAGSGTASVDRGGDTYVLPASLAQERFWALDQHDPGNPTWNLAVRFALRGPLDPAVFERSVQEIVQRHEVLRTNLASVDGRVSQIIASSIPLTLPVEDLRSLPEAERAAAVDNLCLAEAHHRFDLAAGPLLRVRLLKLGDDNHVMTLTVHHAMADYWSIGIIAKELGELYTAYSRSLEPRLAPLAIQYGDYAIWQHNHLQDSQVKNDLAYWKNQLADLPVPAFPADRPRSPNPGHDSAIVSRLLPVELTNSLEEIASREGATFFQLTLAALALVLNQYTRQTSFGLATQVAGRDSLDLEPLVGLFINTVILRMDVSGDPGFSELLHRVRDTATASLANQNLRFEQLLREIQPEIFPSHHAICPLNFICQRDSVKPIEFCGITLTTIPSKSQGAPYELNVFLVMRTEGWRLSCEYNTDLFDSGTIDGLLDNYRSILECVVENPNQRISEIQRLKPVPVPRETISVFAPEQEAAALDDAQASHAAVSELECSQDGAGLTIANASESSPADTYAIPITINQQRFWLLDQLMPGNPTLNMAAALRLHGALDIATLRRSLGELIRRHEMLRTTFSVVDGHAVQVIHPSFELSLKITNLQELQEAEREDTLQRLIHAEALAPFSLATGPLFRTGLIQLDTDDHILMITMPHIICDGWSNGIIVRELTELYEAYSKGLSSPLQELALDYGDFAHWQQEWLKTAAFEEDLSYWKKQLQGRLPLLDLPSDWPRQTGLVSAGAAETARISAESAVTLKEFCRREEITMFMLFLSVFNVMLNRYSGQEDILVGSPVAGRTPETEAIVGPFSFPLSLRTDLSGDLTFRELAHRVRSGTVDALSHKDLPFGRLAEELQTEQVQGRNPLFQVYFLHQVAFLQSRHSSSLLWVPFAWESPGTAFDLHLATLERDDEIIARLEYNSDMFDAGTAQRMLGHFRAIVDAIVENPELRIAEIPLLSIAEAQVIGGAGGALEIERSHESSLLDLLLKQTQATPDADAVFGGSDRLTYRELEVRANDLAERLKGLDLGPERLVGLCTEVAPEMVVGMLAALKAKATFAWVPAASANDRLLPKLIMGGMKAVVTNRRLRKSLLEKGLQVVCLDDAGHSEIAPPRTATLNKSGAGTVACVQFTSGSGGDPKPVLLSHAALSSRVLATAETYSLRGDDRVAIVDSGATSDALFAGLTCGSAVVIVPAWATESEAELFQFLEQEKCTILVLPTRFWHRLSIRCAEDNQKGFPSGLRLVAIHGDRPAASAIAAFRKLTHDQVRCVAVYGTAETGSSAATYELTGAGSVPVDSVVTLGTPSVGVRIRLLDKHLQPPPIGVTAEICVEGASLGIGYLNDSELTEARFRVLPARGGILFRTGDLGRYLPDGRIEFLGPPSRHLNLAGYRLHLGELEAAATRDRAVKEALAIPTPSLGRDQQVTIYVALDSRLGSQRESQIEARLRDSMAEAFSSHFHVSDIVVVDRLVLNRNGHGDQSSLPTLRIDRPKRNRAVVAPRDELESQLVAVWEELLGVCPIGITDSFFELCGHSLLAMRLFAKINAIWATRLPLSILFEAPTIEHLADILRQQGWRPPSSSLVAIRPAGSRPPLFIVSGLGGNVIRFNEIARHLHPDRPLYALQPPGLNGSGPYLTCLEDMAAHYIREIKAKQPAGPYYLAGYSFGGLVTFEMGRQLVEQGDTIGLLALLDSPEWHYQWQSAKAMDSREKVGRYRERVEKIVRGPGRWVYVRTALRKRVTKAIYEVYRQLGWSVPQQIGTIQDINAFAATHYEPQLYPGRLTLLRTRPRTPVGIRDYQLGWGGLAADGVEVHEVPGDHDNMTSGANAQALAQELEACIEGQNRSEPRIAVALGGSKPFVLDAAQTACPGAADPVPRLAQLQRQ
ncbi:MAG: condensation domain-containing protein [Candidatus Binataceae bacterium]